MRHGELGGAYVPQPLPQSSIPSTQRMRDPSSSHVSSIVGESPSLVSVGSYLPFVSVGPDVSEQDGISKSGVGVAQ